MEDLQADRHNLITELEPDLHQIVSESAFGIGPRALLMQALGGLSAIHASHPHMFGAMVAWSYAFGGVPIHLPAGFERWVGRPPSRPTPLQPRSLRTAPKSKRKLGTMRCPY